MKVLFILGTYLPKASANGICVKNLISDLKEKGNEVHCLCWDNIGIDSDSVNGVKIKRIKVSNTYSAKNFKKISKFKYYFFKFSERILDVIFLPLYPNHHIFLSKRMGKEALKMESLELYDCVVSVFQPFDALYSGYKIKKKNPNIKWILYYLDSFSGGPNPFLLFKKFFMKKVIKWDKKFLLNCNHAIIMESYKTHYSKKIFNDFEHKITYSDFPLLCNCNVKKEKKSHSKQITFLLSGKIDYSMRNPERLLALMKLLLNVTDSKFNFCGTLDWEKLLGQFQKDVGEKFKFYGKVDYDIAKKMERDSDVMINIGNQFSNAVPSKIFSYIANGKTILHISSGSCDSSLKYLNLYPKVFIVDEFDEINKKLVDNIIDFVENQKKINIDFSRIKKTFIENTPDYTSKILNNFLEE